MKKSYKITFISIGVILVIGGLFWFGRPNPSNNTGSGLTAGLVSGYNSSSTSNSFDFGTISMANGKVSHNFSIKNTDSDPLVITRIYTSCMCTSATLLRQDVRIGPFGMPGHGFDPSINESLAPGEQAGVEVVFDPAAHGPAGVGKIEREIRLETKSGQPLDFKISALVTP